jgi:hypothetical protein
MQVEWIEEGNVIKIIPLPKDPIEAFRGAGKNRYTSDNLRKDRKKERIEENSRDQRS